MAVKQREGIYVGGKEIVERYVGKQLVWRKRKYILVDTLQTKGWNISGDTIYSKEETWNGIWQDSISTKLATVRKANINGQWFDVSSAKVNSHRGQYNEMYYYYEITFADYRGANLAVSSNETKLYRIEN